MGNDKAKGRQSKKKGGYYDRQFAVTLQNKHRRSAKRRTKKALWEKKKADAALTTAICATV